MLSPAGGILGDSVELDLGLPLKKPEPWAVYPQHPLSLSEGCSRGIHSSSLCLALHLSHVYSNDPGKGKPLVHITLSSSGVQRLMLRVYGKGFHQDSSGVTLYTSQSCEINGVMPGTWYVPDKYSFLF